MRFGTATTTRCGCGRYNIANQDEKLCHTCALISRTCAICEKAVDTDQETEDVKDYCDTYDIYHPDDIFPLEFGWLLRHYNPNEDPLLN